MVPLCAVLVTRDGGLIEFVKGITHALGQVQLETCASLAEAHAHLSRSDLFLLVLHLAADKSSAELAPFLMGRERPRRCPTVVLTDSHPEQELEMLRQAGASTSCRPAAPSRSSSWTAAPCRPA